MKQTVETTETTEVRKEATYTVIELRSSSPSKLDGERPKTDKNIFNMSGTGNNGNIYFHSFGDKSLSIIADMNRGCLFVVRSKKNPDGDGYKSTILAALYPHKNGAFFSDWRDGKKGNYSASIRGVQAEEVIGKLLDANAAYLERIANDVNKAKPAQDAKAQEEDAAQKPAPRRRMK